MGYSRRKESREIVESIGISNNRMKGKSLATIGAAGFLKLDVRCHQCPRRGRYAVDGLVDKFGVTMPLDKLAELLSRDCGNRQSGDTYYRRCGVYFPDVR